MADASVDRAAPEIVRLGMSDISACIDLGCRLFDDFGDDADALRQWFDARITHNPWQPALHGIGIGARHCGRLVGMRILFAQPWWIGGASTVLAFAAHTCVEPHFRGQGLGRQLVAHSRDFATLTGSSSAGNITQQAYAKLGYVAVGGEGNGFFRMRASHVGSVQSRLGERPGRIIGLALDALWHAARTTPGAGAGFRLEPASSCTDEFDAFWVRARVGYGACLDRSRRYLQWRLFERPTHPLSLLTLRDDKGQLRGHGVWHALRYSRHVTCAVLRDLFVAYDDDDARRAFAYLALQHWRRAGFAWVRFEVASQRLGALFAGMGAKPVPSQGNRYWVHGSGLPAADGTQRWLRSALDGDYFDIRPPRTRDAESDRHMKTQAV